MWNAVPRHNRYFMTMFPLTPLLCFTRMGGGERQPPLLPPLIAHVLSFVIP